VSIVKRSTKTTVLLYLWVNHAMLDAENRGFYEIGFYERGVNGSGVCFEQMPKKKAPNHAPQSKLAFLEYIRNTSGCSFLNKK